MEAPQQKKEPFKSETSIFSHPQQFTKKNQLMLPTWGVIVILMIAFVVLKYFIYIPDEKRKGQ